jgi:translation initiation factor 4G
LDDPHHKEILVGEMLSVVEKKESDVEQMSGAIQHLEGEGLLDKASTLNAFKTFMENYDDLTIDVPQAHKYVAQLLIAFKLSPSDVGGEEFAALEKAYAGLKV